MAGAGQSPFLIKILFPEKRDLRTKVARLVHKVAGLVREVAAVVHEVAGLVREVAAVVHEVAGLVHGLA